MPRIDISKKTLDFAVRDSQQFLFHLKVENSLVGLDAFKSYCQEHEVALENSLICCEHTGIYSQHILSLAAQEGISLWLESSTRIKRSIGLQRGKSDKIDAGHPMLSESVNTLFAMQIRHNSGNLNGKSCLNLNIW